MKYKFSKDIMIGTSRTDNTGRLGIAECLDLFMDSAADHAAELGIGMEPMSAKDEYWIVAKTKVRFLHRPNINEIVTLNTWPQKPEHISWVRNYSITSGDELLVAGKSQWAVINMTTGRPVKIQDVFQMPETEIEPPVLEDNFARLKDNFTDIPFGSHKVTSRDIDVGQHMNNVAYVHAFHNLFTTKEWEQMNISEIEIQYKKTCFEGDILEFYSRKDGDTLYVKGAVNGSICILMAIS